ncbi:MAG: SPOR domain-containing protein [Candidatus Omnitrophica bacterium]|nr:SPOR domain-containing protein [Candidatus Omnitrophota bacterium]MCM8826134.1 SPOR domain-containing protein [Candidatus Omnitrophota bacterium]
MKFFRTSTDDDLFSKRKIIKVPLDTILLIGVINILFVILSFSLGVYRGQKSSHYSQKIYDKENVIKENVELLNNKNYINSRHNYTFSENREKKDDDLKISEGKENKIIELSPSDKQMSLSKNISETKKTDNIDSKYIIQVASYLKENVAKKEQEYLEKSGHPVMLSKKGKYIVIYVGEFNTKEEAENTKSILKKRYNDCFVKRR